MLGITEVPRAKALNSQLLAMSRRPGLFEAIRETLPPNNACPR